MRAVEGAPRYTINVEREAATQASKRGKKPFFTTLNKKEEAFVIREAKGPPDSPTELILELVDGGETVSIALWEEVLRSDNPEPPPDAKDRWRWKRWSFAPTGTLVLMGTVRPLQWFSPNAGFFSDDTAILIDGDSPRGPFRWDGGAFVDVGTLAVEGRHHDRQRQGTFGRNLAWEMDLAAESRACERIGAYLETIGVRTPAIHWELTGLRVNVQERLYGRPASSLGASSGDPEVAAFAKCSFPPSRSINGY